MKNEALLKHDIRLSEHRVYGRQTRIHEETVYRHSHRQVIHRERHIRKRLWGLLPAKATETQAVLEIPAHIQTEEDLRGYVRQKRRAWLRHSRG